MAAEQAPEIEIIEQTSHNQPHVMDPYWPMNANCPPDVADDMLPPEARRGGGLKLKPNEKHLIATYCGDCPVRSDCLASALIDGEELGIRGGLSQGQRKPLQKAFNEQGFIEADVWDEAIARAPQVRSAFLAAASRKPAAEPIPKSKPSKTRTSIIQEAEMRKERLLSLLKNQPDTMLVTDSQRSVYSVLSSEFGVSDRQVRYMVGNLAAANMIEKLPHPENPGIIAGLKLVS